MRIIVDSPEEKKCVEVLIQSLQYAWDISGQDCDAYYKAFEYVNEQPENWKDGELVNDHRLLLKKLISNIKNTKIEQI
jgi:hypothetical protein